MHLAIWLVAFVGLIALLGSNVKIKLNAPWKEYAALTVLAAWAIGLMLSFPVFHWGDTTETNCRSEFDKAGHYIVCD